MKRALSGGAGADPDKEVSHSGTTGRTVGAWHRLMMALPAGHCDRPNAVGAHVAERHRLDRFNDARARLAMGLVHYALGYARHPVFIAARRALAAGLARVAGAEVRKAGKLSDSLPPEDTGRRLADQSKESEAVNMESVVSG
jgi:hypothetical protein